MSINLAQFSEGDKYLINYISNELVEQYEVGTREYKIFCVNEKFHVKRKTLSW